MMVPILILAAGASRRMNGPDKLLMQVGGVALLHHVVRRAVATGHPVFVTLPVGNAARREVLDGVDVQIIEVPDADLGMAQSLRTGLQVISPDAAGLLVGLADMPDLTSDDYLSLINGFAADPDKGIHRAATQDGAAGNPVLLPKWALNELDEIQGDVGARQLLRQHAGRVRLVRLPGNHAITDLDTPKDWAAWLAKR